MNKTAISFLLLLDLTAQLWAQSTAGISVGTSKSDRHVEIIWFQQGLTERLSLGLQMRTSAIRYRFVDAQAIDWGHMLFAGLTLGTILATGERYRLDPTLTGSYRFLENEANDVLATRTHGLEIDPNLVFGLQLSLAWVYHSGAMLRTAMQLGPNRIGKEQLPSAIILNGLSYQRGRSLISLCTYAGPMNGARGDTEKFSWQLSLGFQYQLCAAAQGLPFFHC